MFRVSGFPFPLTENTWALATRLLSHKRGTKTRIEVRLISDLHPLLSCIGDIFPAVFRHAVKRLKGRLTVKLAIFLVISGRIYK